MKRPQFMVAALCLVLSASAQQKKLTDADYSAAASLLAGNTQQYIDNGPVRARWNKDNSFWYRNLVADGAEFILVDAVTGKRAPAFDHQRMASAIQSAAGISCSAHNLPFTDISFSDDRKSVTFSAGGRNWKADLSNYTLSPAQNAPRSFNGFGGGRFGGGGRGGGMTQVMSPDGKKAAFIRDNNLWVRDIATRKETQLTTDGVTDFGYATHNAGWTHSNGPVLRWSPDSRKIATFQQDERNVGNMYLVSTQVGHPELQSWKYPLPGDKNIITIQRVIIDVDQPKVVRLQVAPDPHRATLSDDISSSGTFDDVDWNADASQLAFVSTSRDHKIEKFRIADAATGAVREVFTEEVPTQYESGQGAINWRYLAASHEIIWYSERDNWGHLYLYDAETGKPKNLITKGDFVVTRMLKVDEANRTIYFLADGIDKKNPYFTHFCKVQFDGSGLKDLTPETGTHSVSFSPDGNYFIDDYSQPDVPNVSVLRKLDGTLVTTLEKTDISRLTATGWHAPTPVALKAADGKTDIYGIMFTPEKLDTHKKYPVVVYIYPGPQGGSVGSWAFSASRGDNNALANLGFIVVAIEGTSNPNRSKSFHDMSYGRMAINTLPDQVAGVRQLAARYGYLDTTRVGIWGHSGGGFATACAMFTFPDFFKVGISESGNHDNRNYEDDWGERYIGLEQKDADGVSNYEWQANQVHAKNLKGKLLLAHGLLDDNVPPSNTFLVVDALEKANKDYDLIVFPNSRHGYGNFSNYMMRRRWDYFVKNLMGAEPPKEFEIRQGSDPRNGRGE